MSRRRVDVHGRSIDEIRRTNQQRLLQQALQNKVGTALLLTALTAAAVSSWMLLVSPIPSEDSFYGSHHRPHPFPLLTGKLPVAKESGVLPRALKQMAVRSSQIRRFASSS
ncbi:hypothetical protein IWX49DRAFT_595282 [Phyllosticta citricarpa]